MGDGGYFRESVGAFWGSWVVFWGVALGMGGWGVAGRIWQREQTDDDMQQLRREDWVLEFDFDISVSGEQSLARFVFM